MRVTSIGAMVGLVLMIAVGCRSSNGTSAPSNSAPPGVIVLGPDDAPFAYPGQDRTGAPAPVGYPVSFGSLVLGNTTDEPITITKIEAREVDPGAAFLGVKIATGADRRDYATGSVGGFPPDNPGANFQDPPTVIAPSAGPHDRGVDLVVGMKATAPGNQYIKGLIVSYRRGGRDYVTTYDNTFLVCTDFAKKCEFDTPTTG